MAKTVRVNYDIYHVHHELSHSRFKETFRAVEVRYTENLSSPWFFIIWKEDGSRVDLGSFFDIYALNSALDKHGQALIDQKFEKIVLINK